MTDDDQLHEMVEPLCSSVEEWVETIYIRTYIQRAAGSVHIRWCAEWWQHAEAIVRRSAPWRTWEEGRATADDPAAMANWIVRYVDSINAVLLGSDGPFGICTPDKHEDQRPMPAQPAPPGWWGD